MLYVGVLLWRRGIGTEVSEEVVCKPEDLGRLRLRETEALLRGNMWLSEIIRLRKQNTKGRLVYRYSQIIG